MSEKYYFLQESEKLAGFLSMHHDTWMQFGSNPLVQAWLRNSIAYYSAILEPNDWQSALGFVGEQGELVRCVINQARSLARQVVTLATKERLYFRCIAESQGADITQAIRLGNALTSRIIQDQQLDRKDELAVEQAYVLGMGFFHVAWRTDKGAPYAAHANDTIQYDGDLEITNPTVYDVYFDTRITDWKQLNWAEVKKVHNRYDLIAQHPDLEEHILAVPRIMESTAIRSGVTTALDGDDLINVYECYHKPTPSLPEGRMIVYSNEKTIYYDGPNLYECIPIIPIKPEPVLGMGYGFPAFSNLLPAQEMFDHSISAIATNQSATAVQQIACPRDANIGVHQIGGLNFLLYTPQSAAGGGKPEPLQLTQSAPETFKFAPMLKQEMLELSNLNSAVRGAPPPGVTSGTAIATLTANALEFLNSLSKANDLALEEVMDVSFSIFKKFAKTPRSIAMVGKNMKSQQRDFTGDDLGPIQHIRIQRSNPLMATLAGRSDVAEKLLQTGMLKSPQEYISIIEGQPLSQLYETELSENDLMESENDMLAENKEVFALSTDDHPAHIRKHAALLNDPVIRANGKQVGLILAHMTKHEELAKTEDPFLTAMVRTGKMPDSGPPPPGPPGPPQGGPPPGPPHGPPPGAPMGAPNGKPLPQMMPPAMATKEPAGPAKDNLSGMR